MDARNDEQKRQYGVFFGTGLGLEKHPYIALDE